MIILGECTNCGGVVAKPSVEMSVIPITPACISCGAAKLNENSIKTAEVGASNVKWSSLDILKGL